MAEADGHGNCNKALLDITCEQQCLSEDRIRSQDVPQLTEQSTIDVTPVNVCSSDLARSDLCLGVNDDSVAFALNSSNHFDSETLVSADKVTVQFRALDVSSAAHSKEEDMEAAAASEVSKLDFSFLPEVEAMIERKRAAVSRLKEERDSFMQNIELAEAEIHRMVEQLYGLVDNKTNELLATAASVRADRLSQYERTKSELESTLNTMTLNTEFAEQVMSNASPEDMLLLAPAVHLMNEHLQREQERVLELARIPDEDDRLAELTAFAGLDAASWARRAGGNLIGQINTSESVEAAVASGNAIPYLKSSQPLNGFSTGGRVKGLAFFKSYVYVLLERCSVVNVHDCEASDCRSIYQVAVEQLNFPEGIVTVESVQCVFISDSQVSGLFRISLLDGVNVDLIPLESVPSGLSVLPTGHLVFTYVETKTVQLASADDVSIIRVVSVSDLCRPVGAIPVPGDNNGTVICDETEHGLHWFLCGHKLEGGMPELEQPVPLHSLNNVCCLVSDSYGMYVGMNTVSDCINVFDASFNKYQQLLTTSDDLRGISCFALNSHSGRMAVALHDGTVRLFQVMQTRQRIEIKLNKWM